MVTVVVVTVGWSHEVKPMLESRTKIMDVRGFDSSIILILRGGIPGPIWNFLESLSPAILV